MIVTDGLLFLNGCFGNLIGNAVRYTEHGGYLPEGKENKEEHACCYLDLHRAGGITKEDQA